MPERKHQADAEQTGSRLFINTRLLGLEPVPPPRESPVKWIDGIALFTYDACKQAIDETVRAVRELVARVDVARRLEACKLTVVIIPRDRKLTELGEFWLLRGQETFDGRSWDEVRGVANVKLPDGRTLVGVGEDRILDAIRDPRNNSTLRHELAHVIHRHGSSEDEERAIQASYDLRKARNGPWTDDYGSTNSDEYFAQATIHYLGLGVHGYQGSAWLAEHDPRLHSLLAGLYGPR
jgi:hypothetical protein